MANYTDTSLLEALSNERTQYIIPIYQRGYNWEIEQIKKLIDDLIDFVQTNKDATSKYYIGNIVTKTLQPEPGVLINRHVVVDGQQRITTSLLLVLALMNVDYNEFSDLIKYIELRGKSETRLKIDRLNDGSILEKILYKKPLTSEEEKTNIFLNYEFAKKYIKENNISKMLFQGLQQTLLFNVILGNDENENKVFETINSTGLALSESDLIKNYIFFHSHSFTEQQEKDLVYKYKCTISKKINPNQLNDFYRYYIANKSSDKKLVSLSAKNTIYNAFKEIVVERQMNHTSYNDVLKIIDELKDFAKLWEIVNSNTLKANGVNKFYLDVFNANQKTYFMLYAELMIKFNKQLDPNVTFQILKKIAKLIIFRTIAAEPDSNIVRSVPLMVRTFLEEKEKPSLKNFDTWISQTKHAYAQPTITKMKAISSSNNAYNNKKKLINVLKAYELSLIKNGTPADLTIKFSVEHIMPQSFEAHWFPNLNRTSPEYFQKTQEMNTLGNLTLLTIPMNSSLSNSDFKTKVNGNSKTSGFKNDLLQMNQYISKRQQWTSNEINKRTDNMIDSICEWFDD